MWLENDWSSWLRYWRALAMLSWSVVYLLLLTLYADRRFGIYLESIEYEWISNVFCLCAVPSVDHSIKCFENVQSFYILHLFYCLIFVNLLNEHNVLINVHSKCYVVIFYIIFKNVYLFSSLYLHMRSPPEEPHLAWRLVIFWVTSHVSPELLPCATGLKF